MLERSLALNHQTLDTPLTTYLPLGHLVIHTHKLLYCNELDETK